VAVFAFNFVAFAFGFLPGDLAMSLELGLNWEHVGQGGRVNALPPGWSELRCLHHLLHALLHVLG
jgi:hypothetical protein